MSVKNEKIKKWVVDMDRMIKVGHFYTDKQRQILEKRYLRIGFSISYDHDDWMCISNN
jgi:hypothetical protein